MTVSPRKFARAFALLILLTGLPVAKYPISFLTNIDAYDNTAGLMMVAGALIYFVVMGGAIALIVNKPVGYVLVFVGTILSAIGGTFWSYIPMLPWLFDSPDARYAAIVIGNIVVLAFLAWCQFKERDQVQPHGAV